VLARASVVRRGDHCYADAGLVLMLLTRWCGAGRTALGTDVVIADAMTAIADDVMTAIAEAVDDMHR
jgi:hypothetical protein